jgi:ABC-type transport system substrate-binding protein/Zn-dependent protease with chaperone function
MNLHEHIHFSPIIDTLGHVLLHSLWQGVGIAGVLAIGLKFGNTTPTLRYNLAVFSLSACVLLSVFTYQRLTLDAQQATIVNYNAPYQSLPALTGPVFTSQEGHTPVRSPDLGHPSAAAAVNTTPPSLPYRIQYQVGIRPLLPYFVGLWLLGVIFLSIKMVLGLRLIAKLRTHYVYALPNHLRATASRLAKRFQGKRFELRLSHIADVPMVVGFFKPVILIPVSTISGLSPVQLEMIIAHEMAHIHRYDHIVNLLQNIIETLLFFNPAIWWISAQIRQEREYCCDMAAVNACQAKNLAYAQALATLHSIRPHNTLTLAYDGGSLLKRILRLTGKPNYASVNPIQWMAGAILIVLAIFIATVATAQTQGGTLRIAYASIQQLDPYKSANNDEINAFSQVFDSLIVISKDDFQPIPHLALSWETPDDTTWVFTLREGVTFHDGNEVFPEGAGRELTADDVVYSINRFLEVSTAFTLGNIESATALDRYTVEIKTTDPDPFLITDPNRLARVLIVPQEAVEQLGEEGFARNPIGSGPFKLVSFTPDQRLEFSRNEDYWLPVNLDGVEFIFIPDPTVQTIALEAGEVDVISYIFNIDSVTQLSENPDLTLIERGGSYRGLGFNVTTPPFDEFEVRDAISKAMNIDAAVNAVVAPFGIRAYGQVPPWTSFEQDPGLADLWTYDPEAALEQLAAVGFTDSNGDGILDRDGQPLSFNIKTIPGSQVRVLTILVTQLRELGIDANILQQDVAVWADDLQTGNDTGLFFDYSFAGTTGLYSLFHSSNNGRTNTHFYENPEVDALLDEASRTIEFETRNRLWLEAQRLIMQDRAAIPLYFESGYSVVNNRVQDFVPPWGGLNLVSLENNVSINR